MCLQIIYTGWSKSRLYLLRQLDFIVYNNKKALKGLSTPLLKLLSITICTAFKTNINDKPIPSTFESTYIFNIYV